MANPSPPHEALIELFRCKRTLAPETPSLGGPAGTGRNKVLRVAGLPNNAAPTAPVHGFLGWAAQPMEISPGQSLSALGTQPDQLFIDN